MPSYCAAAKLLMGVAGLALAQTPQGVFPQVNNNLAVAFNGQAVAPGAQIPANLGQSVPQIGIPRTSLSGNTAQRYVMMLLDVDSADGSNTKRKRAENVPQAPAATAAADAAQQPDDAQHSGGRNTFLHAMVQDYQANTNTDFNGGGAVLLQSASNSGPVGWQAPNPQSGNHRYMMLLFEQPEGFSVPGEQQAAAAQRTNFDLRQFMQASNLPLPRWGNYFQMGNGQSNSNIGTGQTVISPTTYTTATTFPNGGPTQSFLAVSTVTSVVNNGVNNGGNFGVGTPSLTTVTATTTFPNGGATQTFLSVSTTFVNGEGSFTNGFGSTFLTTFTTTTTFNGVEQTLIGVSTAFAGNSFGTIIGGGEFDSGVSYTTGFTGLRTTTSTGRTRVSTTTTDSTGRVSSGATDVSTTVTRTFSGVSRVSTTTFSTTSETTTTGIINGQFSTSTSTFVGLTTQVLPNFNSAAKRQNGAEYLVEKAVMGLAGLALAWL